MSGVFSKAMVYLGLVEEPEDVPGGLPALHQHESGVGRRSARTATLERGDIATWNDDDPIAVASPSGDGEVRVIPLRDRDARPLPPADAHVRVSGHGVRAAVARISAFDDVETVVQRLRSGQPVMLDLGAVDAVTARRVLDFTSGANFALGGRMQPFVGKAFLATPNGGDVANEELERLAALGYQQAGS